MCIRDRHQCLDAGLAVAAGHREHLGRAGTLQATGERAQRQLRVRDHDLRDVDFDFVRHQGRRRAMLGLSLIHI